MRSLPPTKLKMERINTCEFTGILQLETEESEVWKHHLEMPLLVLSNGSQQGAVLFGTSSKRLVPSNSPRRAFLKKVRTRWGEVGTSFLFPSPSPSVKAPTWSGFTGLNVMR